MAVEIHVLSGTLHGQCLRFDGDRIAIGDDERADLRFSPDQEPGSRGKSALLTLDDETGWEIRNNGIGVWLVNQTAVPAGDSMRLRSDDLVRVSEFGPEFCFRLVARARAAAIPPPVTLARHVPPKSGEPAWSEVARAPSLNRSPHSETDAKMGSASQEERDPFEAVLNQLPERRPRAAAAGAVMRKDGKVDQTLPGTREGGVRTDTKPSDPVAVAAAQLPAEPAAPKKKRRLREASTLGRFIGIVVAGLLGLACAYGLACWFGGK